MKSGSWGRQRGCTLPGQQQDESPEAPDCRGSHGPCLGGQEHLRSCVPSQPLAFPAGVRGRYFRGALLSLLHLGPKPIETSSVVTGVDSADRTPNAVGRVDPTSPHPRGEVPLRVRVHVCVRVGRGVDCRAVVTFPQCGSHCAVHSQAGFSTQCIFSCL